MRAVAVLVWTNEEEEEEEENSGQKNDKRKQNQIQKPIKLHSKMDVDL